MSASHHQLSKFKLCLPLTNNLAQWLMLFKNTLFYIEKSLYVEIKSRKCQSIFYQLI